MRPLRLEIKGFTSFRDEQAIDFEELESPFAIVGPTGSGKSSLLDAMTYALFGEVDRVKGSDTPMREMVSQGQPRMAVAFEFEVNGDRWRVTRSMPRNGATKILVQRYDGGGDWKQAGEGADRVRDANKLLRDAIGLDFDGFTRSVLLPQGKFSAFMAGDADQRRKILTELLGLNVFDRMGKRARQIAKEANDRAATFDELIGSQFAEATPEALAAARSLAEGAAERHTKLAAAAERVTEVVGRWKSVADEVRELRACATDASGVAAALARQASALAKLTDEAADVDGRLRAATEAAESATSASEAAAAAVEEAERKHGTAADLARAGEQARALAIARAEAVRREDAAAEAAARVPDAATAASVAEDELARAAAAAADAAAAATATTRAREEVEHAHAVAALVGSLKVGDPCPVCGDPLDAIPKSPGDRAVRDARAADDRARKQSEATAAGVGTAERNLERARSGVTVAENESAAAARELEACRMTEAELVAAVTQSLGGHPEDPLEVVTDRTRRLNELIAAAKAAFGQAQAADHALREANGLRDRIVAGARESAAALGAVTLAPIAVRAEAIDGAPAPPDEAALPPIEYLDGLAAAAAGRADGAAAYAKSLAAAADDRAGSEPAFLREAAALVEGLVPAQPTLANLATAVADAVTTSIREHEQRTLAVERVERDLEKVAAMRADAATSRDRARVFGMLAQELRADRLIAFLQAEALRLLAIGGSARLQHLSGGRYELAYPDDEFLVVDRWNGDETRSVRTLSGGETFLASLALALALAEQVSSLAVTKHASLDSLFLDEGFGTLDPETLETVVEAIEQLGGDGRMVGVITHVRELADRMPSRLEIVKSPRGSTVHTAV
ncbi:MAG TPA: SMC family ATPase [Actinomycetota bacterium]|nr:SMC family ATPase [Actinomycetota bacterium]